MSDVDDANLRAFIMGAPAALCILRGPEHRFEAINPKYAGLIGDRDVVGLPLREAIPEAEGQGFVELLDRVFTTGEPFCGNEVPAWLQGANGTLAHKYFNFTYLPMRDHHGAIDGIAVYASEVTEFIAAREALAGAL